MSGTRLSSRHAGFTLIEVLVVLVIISVMASGISLSMDILRSRDTEQALERLRLVLETTAERAQTRGQPIAFELLPDSYRFSVLDTNDKWLAYDEPPVFGEKLLPDTLHWVALRTASGKTERLVFGNRAPRYELTVQTPEGVRTLSGNATGAVQISNASPPPS